MLPSIAIDEREPCQWLNIGQYSLLTKLDIYFSNSIDAKTSFSLLKDTNSMTQLRLQGC